jgi:tetratricopeptide (TPR) repeat protein
MRHFYLSKPTSDGIFVALRKRDTPIDGISLYEFELFDDDPDKANFRLINNDTVCKMITEKWDSYVVYACGVRVGRRSRPRNKIENFVTLTDGVAKQLESGNWEVEKKAVIDFTESDAADNVAKKPAQTQALSEIRQETRQENELTDEPDTVKAIAMCREGEEFGRKKKFNEAIERFDKAIVFDRNCVTAYRDRSRAYLRTDELNKAEADIDTALALNKDDKKTLEIQRVVRYCKQGDDHGRKDEFKEAVECFDNAIELDSKCVAAYRGRGRAYDKMGESDKAIVDFDRAIELNPNATRAYYLRGLTYRAMGDSDRAMADFDKALELDPAHFQRF